MSDHENGLSDDDLWIKCQQDTPITPSDLNLSASLSGNAIQSLNEDTNFLQFSADAADKKKH